MARHRAEVAAQHRAARGSPGRAARPPARRHVAASRVSAVPRPWPALSCAATHRRGRWCTCRSGAVGGRSVRRDPGRRCSSSGSFVWTLGRGAEAGQVPDDVDETPVYTGHRHALRRPGDHRPARPAEGVPARGQPATSRSVESSSEPRRREGDGVAEGDRAVRQRAGAAVRDGPPQTMRNVKDDRAWAFDPPTSSTARPTTASTSRSTTSRSRTPSTRTRGRPRTRPTRTQPAVGDDRRPRRCTTSSPTSGTSRPATPTSPPSTSRCRRRCHASSRWSKLDPAAGRRPASTSRRCSPPSCRRCRRPTAR